MPRIDVHCDEELYQRVRERALLEGRSLSNLARRALHLYLEGMLVERFAPRGTDNVSTSPDPVSPDWGERT